MEKTIQKAAVLIEALPYIRQFEGKTVVVKYGGAAMLDPELRRSTAEDIVLMKYVGMNPVVVHGGGPAINKRLDQLGIESVFHDGLRVTDRETVDVVEMVLAGSVNKDVVGLINQAGGSAVGLCGKDGHLLHARRLMSGGNVDIGHVGEITGVDSTIVRVLCDAGMIPVVAPIATDTEGGTWNINADTAAGRIAASLSAEKLVFLTDTPGLLRDVTDPKSLVHQLRLEDIERLTNEGVIAGGMIPKVEACVHGLKAGVEKTHIVDGRVSHALLLEFFTDEGVGTLVSH